MKYICYFGHSLAAIILTKLIFLGKKLNFLNICFISIFFYETVGGLFLIPNFFSVGQLNWFGDSKPEEAIEECGKLFPVHTNLFKLHTFSTLVHLLLRPRQLPGFHQYWHDLYKVR